MTNQKFYDDSFIKSSVLEIARVMYAEGYKPDYIVGLSRGGLIPSVLCSHYLRIPFHPLNPNESNCWMAEDAFGYNLEKPLKILIMDDINDTGKTFKNIVEDWQASCKPYDDHWKDVWHNTVKFASIIHNEASEFESDYRGHTINKIENPEWCVFPWERWW